MRLDESQVRSSAVKAAQVEDAILTCRLIDRPLRPSFVGGFATRFRLW